MGDFDLRAAREAMLRMHQLLALLWVTVSVLWCAAASSHDLGAMQVTCTFRHDNSYLIEVLIDREHLPFRIAREPITQFASSFLEQSHFEFDGRAAAPPQLLQLQEAPNNKINTFRLQLRGDIPMGAANFAYSNQLEVGEYFVRLKNEGDALNVGYWLRENLAHPPFALRQPPPKLSTFDVIRQYVVLGFTHIIPKGLDHILFVLGLFLLSMRAKPLLLQVTAFTVAHSITLALSIYGVVSLPASIVEPLIALSIAYVAIENVVLQEYRPWRPVVVFAFGLLHGLGFAGVLQELGLPREQFAQALVAFNVGVEFGQLGVITAAFLAVGVWFGRKPWYRSRIVLPGSVAIAAMGLYWTVQRIFFV